MSRQPIRRPGAMIPPVVASLFKKPATMRYPFAPTKMPDGFRGPPRFDSNKCIGCNICVRDCPSPGTITITKVGQKQFECSSDLGKCVYCGQCAESCPKDVITMSADFELAQLDRGVLTIVYHRKPSPPASAEPVAPQAT